jgi:hypothetical protein
LKGTRLFPLTLHLKAVSTTFLAEIHCAYAPVSSSAQQVAIETSPLVHTVKMLQQGHQRLGPTKETASSVEVYAKKIMEIEMMAGGRNSAQSIYLRGIADSFTRRKVEMTSEGCGDG